MFDRNRRPALKLAARRWARQGKIDKATLREILDNDDLADAVLAEAHGMQEAEVAGPITDFLSWLFENQDKIIALIQKIMALFMAP